MSIIRTVSGDIDAARFARLSSASLGSQPDGRLDISTDSHTGIILGHEHVIAHPPADVSDADLLLDDEQAARHELSAVRAAGGAAVIEMTTIDYGRDAAALRRVSEESGIHIIAATGYNKGKFADRLTMRLSVDEIADRMVSEVQMGIGTSGARAGVIKASSSLHGPGDAELKVFRAAAITHQQTGAPISTHTEKGTWALEQVRLLTSLGVPANRILVGHLDLHADLAYLRDVAATGVFLGIDQFGKAKYLPDAERVRLVVALIQAGHLEQVILSGDMARRSYWQAYGGGPGLTQIPTSIQPMLRAAGLSRGEVDTILRANPARFLMFEPH